MTASPRASEPYIRSNARIESGRSERSKSATLHLPYVVNTKGDQVWAYPILFKLTSGLVQLVCTLRVQVLKWLPLPRWAILHRVAGVFLRTRSWLPYAFKNR